MSKKKSAKRSLARTSQRTPLVPADLLTDIHALIEQARDNTARVVNSAVRWRPNSP
jgi:hypothetical protein